MGTESEYILRWNDYSNNFFSCAEELYLRESLTDVTLCVEDQHFDAHRFILCVSSPFFRDLLTKVPRDRHPVVFLRDIPAPDIERLLRFMYRGEMRLPHSELESLLESATILQIRGLSKHSSGNENKNSTNTSGGRRLPPSPEIEEKTSSIAEDPNHPLGGISTSSSTLPSSSSSSSSSHLKATPNKKRRARSPSPPLALGPPARSSLPGRPKEEEPDLPPEGRLSFHEFKAGCPSGHPGRMESSSSSIPGAVSPPRQTESVPILSERSESSLSILPNPGILAECRNTGTCYFCKKSFMKNKQLMNHVCPVKPKILLQKKTSSSSLR